MDHFEEKLRQTAGQVPPDFSKHLPQREQKDQHPEEQYSKSRQAFLIWQSLFPSLNTPVSELTVYRVAHQMQSLKVHQAQKE
ncbi:hypothetical protein ACFX12_023229 [Malus domestica]